MPELLRREFELRAPADGETWEVAGIGVPYDDPTTISTWYGDYTETFARGAVEVDEDVMLFWRHSDPIGLVTEHTDEADGWHFRASISQTARGAEAHQLAVDGVVKRFSVGFEPLEHTVDDETGNITRTRVKVREVSLVPLPAYDGAVLTEVRHRLDPRNHPAPPKENRMDPQDTLTRADLDAVATEQRSALEDFEREIRTAIARGGNADPEPVDTRSLGEVLKAIVANDEDTIRAYNELQERAFEGTTTAADGITRPGWVGDLTRLVEVPDRLSGLFATGTLPASGTKLEYGQLKSNTAAVAKQENEGDDLVGPAKVEVEVKYADIDTIGGWTQLSRQAIERSSINVLDLHLRAMGLAARKDKTTRMRAAFGTAVARERAAGNTVAGGAGDTYDEWLSAIIDAAEKYEDLGLSLDALVTSKDLFKKLATLKGADDRPLLTVFGTGVNTVGVIDAKALDANLANVLVRPNLKQQTSGAAFITRDAIRVYDSPLASLQDENIINLTKAYSVYLYSAIAHEIPAGIVPIAFTAAQGA